MTGMLHWLNTELWGPMWPNVAAPSLWTLLGIGASHWHQVRLHRQTREHVAQASSTEGGERGR